MRFTIDADDVMLGYYRDEAATRDVSVDGWLRTGDLGVMHPDGYVTLREGQRVAEAELITHVRERLAHFKAPHRVVFGELPKTSTGKIQKTVLRAGVRGVAEQEQQR